LEFFCKGDLSLLPHLPIYLFFFVVLGSNLRSCTWQASALPLTLEPYLFKYLCHYGSIYLSIIFIYTLSYNLILCYLFCCSNCSNMASGSSFFAFLFFLVVLGLDLGAYTLSHSTSPFCDFFFLR
jgi:hypothetical protein